MTATTPIRDVQAWCPRCHAEHSGALATARPLPGRLVADDHVWLERDCPDHGRIVTLYDEEPAILRYLEQWTAPTKPATPDDPTNDEPLPRGYRRGLGARQTQHTCVLLQDVTNACNLRCPTCFASSSPDHATPASTDSILANVDRRLHREGGQLDVVMVSGGEPTVHPQLLEILDGLQDRNIARILLNTNGIRLSRDDDLLAYLTEHRDRCDGSPPSPSCTRPCRRTPVSASPSTRWPDDWPTC